MSNTAALLKAYKIGDSDNRPWGSYVVTNIAQDSAGMECCEKRITVNPGQVLSLQSHEHRREYWRVEQGTLTVILDDQRLDLNANEDIRIPQGGIHCMANLSTEPCVVYEKQEGVCREDDIKRYVDAYGRGTEMLTSTKAAESIALYNGIVADIQESKRG